MKRFILLSILIAFAFGLNAQKYKSIQFTIDTLDDAETVNFTSSERFFDLGVLEYHVAVDSIDGTPAGTISYQYSLDADGSEWYTAGTDTIADAAETSAQFQVANFSGFQVRINVVGSGTQECELTPFVSFKRTR